MGTTDNKCTILLAEDDQDVRRYLEMALTCKGYSVETAQDGEEALSIFEDRRESIAAVLLGLVMPRKDGLETLRQLRVIDGTLPVIMLSASSSPLKIVEAMKEGASDFLVKPLNHDQLCVAIEKALGTRAAPRLACVPRRDAYSLPQTFIGTGPRMREMQSLIGQISLSEVPVLIQGETGVGKEVLARELHARSPRAQKPFLKLNCAALPPELVESELFGYERGAFTGAFQRKPGMFEMADQGTILLDEIGDMDFKLQAKLLQVLQDQQFQRLGGKDTVRVDVRIIAATHRDLESCIANGTFRADLYYRLNVIRIQIPALRDRTEDILPLAQFFLKKHCPSGISLPPIPAVLNDALVMHSWPGNIRELENVIRRLIVIRNPEAIADELRSNSAPRIANTPPAADTPPATEPPRPPVSHEAILEHVRKAKHRAEADAILAALDATRWNRKKASVLLGLDYKALLYKMKKLSIEGKIVSFCPDRAREADGGQLTAVLSHASGR